MTFFDVESGRRALSFKHTKVSAPVVSGSAEKEVRLSGSSSLAIKPFQNHRRSDIVLYNNIGYTQQNATRGLRALMHLTYIQSNNKT